MTVATSAGEKVILLSGAGFTGKGWVSIACSPGTSVCGTGLCSTPYTGFPSRRSRINTSPVFDGNIGETILSRFAHVILDYGRNAMILQTQPSTTRPFEERRTYGLSIVAGSPDLHQFTVTAVGADSAAAKAGFQKGDVITAIDDVAAATLDLAAVQRLFRADGTQHDVVVRRGSQEVKIHATITTAAISRLH